MRYENWLYTSSSAKTISHAPLKKNIRTDCLVIGAGFTGLHAALRLANSGKKVVLLEKTFCGGGSSGQSGGFLTPESEKDIDQLIQVYGEKRAHILHNIPKRGVQLILDTIKQYKFNCDLRKQDSLYLAYRKPHEKWLKEEARLRKETSSPYKILKGNALKKTHPVKNYSMGLKYPGSHGINSFLYCQEMKNLLIKKGVKIYENSEVHKIKGNTAKTRLGSVTAKNILICIDKMKTEFDEEISRKIYHIQSYITISEPLTEKEIKALYPKGELMCWDTRIIYMYYRPVDGNRILVGGAGLLETYSPTYSYSPKVIKKFIDEFKERFPQLKNISFTTYWSGLIDITQDLEPLVDYDKQNKSIQYALGCAGLPWAAFCGDYIARRVVSPKKAEDLSEFTRIDRNFLISGRLQKFLGKRISFAISHLKEYFQT